MHGTPTMPEWPDSIDTSDDFLVWTNTITVTYLSKTAERPPSETPVTPEVSHVLWFQIRKDRIAADSILQNYDRTFRFATKVLQALPTPIVPKEGDIIIDDLGLRWKVELVEVLSYQNEYRVHTTKSTRQGQPVGSPVAV